MLSLYAYPVYISDRWVLSWCHRFNITDHCSSSHKYPVIPHMTVQSYTNLIVDILYWSICFDINYVVIILCCDHIMLCSSAFATCSAAILIKVKSYMVIHDGSTYNYTTILLTTATTRAQIVAIIQYQRVIRHEIGKKKSYIPDRLLCTRTCNTTHRCQWSYTSPTLSRSTIDTIFKSRCQLP